MAKKGSSEFETLNQEAVSHRYLQVGPDQSVPTVFSVSHIEDLPMIPCRWLVWKKGSLIFSEFGL